MSGCYGHTIWDTNQEIILDRYLDSMDSTGLCENCGSDMNEVNEDNICTGCQEVNN